MTRIKRCLLLVGLVLLLPGTAGSAQVQGIEEGWQVYTNANHVRDLVLEGGGALSGGYTWAATTGGVVCYGISEQVKFITLDGLADNDVYAVAMDGEGRLWLGTWGGGVSVLDDGGTPFDKSDDTWTTFTTADGLADNYVRAIAADGAARLWFGTDGGGASVLDHGGTPFDKSDDTWTTFTESDGLADHYVWASAVDGGGRLWFCTLVGVSVLDHGGTPFDKSDDTWTTFTESDGLADNSVGAIAVDGGGQLWFGTYGGGVSVLDHGGTPLDKNDDTWTTFTESDGLADNIVYAVAVHGGGWLWFGTYGGGVSVLDHGGTPFDKGGDTWTTFTESDGLAYNIVNAVAVHGGGWLWFGTSGGMSVLDDGGTPFDKGDDTWTTFTESDGLAYNVVGAIAEDGEGRLWLGTTRGVSVLDHGGTSFDKEDDTWTTFSAADGLGDNEVNAIAVDGGGQLWFGTWDGGVSVLDHGGTPFDKGDDTWITFTESDGLADNIVYAVAVDGEARLWFGTSGGGVSVLDDGSTPFDKTNDTWTTLTTADGLAQNYVRAIAVDGGGRLWFGTYYGGVSVLDDGGTPFNKGDDTWASFTTADGLTDNHVNAVAVDGVGRLWSGTRGGVSVLNHGGTPSDKTDDTWITFTTADGLADNDVLAIAVDDRWHAVEGKCRKQRLWFGTHGGVSVVGKACHVYLPIALKSSWDPYYEDNDHWLDAYGPLTCGQTYLAYPDDTEDYYYFVLSAPATCNVSVENYAPTSSNGTVALYGPVVGDEMGDLIDYYGPPDHSSMYLGPHSLGPGKYYVRVYTAQDHSSTQLYRLKVDCSFTSSK
jgi:ligand-binding sensor domain-containing protein